MVLPTSAEKKHENGTECISCDGNMTWTCFKPEKSIVQREIDSGRCDFSGS